MSIAIERLKRAIADLPKGGMQTGSPKVTLKLADAERAIAELEGLKTERDALAAQVTDLEFQRVCAVTQATNMFDALRLAIAAFDKYEMSVDDYPSIEHVRMRERLYSAAFLNADRHLAEIRAEAIEQCRDWVISEHERYSLSYYLTEYAAIIRQGGD